MTDKYLGAMAMLCILMRSMVGVLAHTSLSELMVTPEMVMLARWLAKKAIKAQWRAMGRRPDHIEARKISEAANA